ncbi:MAG: TAXI family TRAP transporter solute-binding subunit [Hyphomicrobiales bacterium]|nr:TAXI family TRAP transporter solute-binding subunit [Hyphomicrobiales bacterium]
MKLLKVLIGAVVGATFGCAAHAQSVSLGTSAQGSATYNIASAIAKVAGEKAGLNVVVQPQGSTGKVLPLVNSGQLHFGLANILETSNAIKGLEPSEGKPNPNLKVVAVMYPFATGYFVRKDHPAKTIKDLKGLKISSEYSAHKIIGILATSHLANAGLEWSDVQGVPTANIIGNANDFTEGKTEAGFFALTAGKVQQMNAAVGGLRFLSVDDSPEAMERARKFVPPAFVVEYKPRKGLVGIEEPTKLMVYDYLIYAGAHVSDETVYKVTKMMAENKSDLAAAFGGFNGLDPKAMHKNNGLDYHPGAIKFYTEAGLLAQ